MFDSVSGKNARAVAMRMVRNFTIGMIVAISGTNIVIDGPGIPLIVIAALLAACATLADHAKVRLSPVIVAIALTGQAIVFTASFTGHLWQLDSHMLFFVVLAVVALMRSVPALVVSAAVIALHHLFFGIWVPSLVFPSFGLIENLERVALHGTVVVLEVTFLTIAMIGQNKQEQAEAAAREAASKAKAEAEDAAAQAQSLRRKAEAADKAARDVTAALAHNLNAMARRDLSARMGDGVSADFSELAQDYNTALDILSRILSETFDMVCDVEAEANAASQMTDEMAVQLEGQAAQVSEAANEIRTLTASLERTVADIGGVSASAQDASNKATEGGEIVRAAVTAMSAIKSSSAEIEKIISVIEDISFQTNLLALNAGVEAARAGPAGAGFAVVASEVRALSHRTSEAANQVKALISKSVTHVAEGAAMVDRAGVALDEIEETVSQASQRVADVSRRASEQSRAVQDVADALGEIDTVIHSCAAKTEELSAMGARISNGSGGLHGSLGTFSFRAGASGAARENAA